MWRLQCSLIGKYFIRDCERGAYYSFFSFDYGGIVNFQYYDFL